MSMVFTRLVIAALLATGLASGALAQGTAKPKSSLNAEIASQFADQSAGAITPSVLRTVTQDMVASWQQGAGVNAQVGITYTVVGDTSGFSDNGKVVTFNNASPVAVTLPGAGAAGFNPFSFYALDVGSGAVTITPSIGTINGAGSLVLAQNQSVLIVSDGTNWQVIKGFGSGTVAGPGSTTSGDLATWANNSGSLLADLGTSAAGQIINSTAAHALSSTATPTLGIAGTTAGSLTFANTTSGAVTLQTVSGALGSVTASLPANTGTLAELNLAQTWTAVQTFTNSDIALLGSSTGKTTFTSDNAGASNFTVHFPAVNDTLAMLGANQTLSGNDTFSGQAIHTGTSAPASAAGNTVVMGTMAAPTLTNTAQGFVFNTAAGGLNLAGDGSTDDIRLVNKSGATAANVPTGTTNLNVVGTLTFGTLSATSLGASTSTVTGLTINNSPNASNDYIPYYSASAGAIVRCTVGACGNAATSGVSSLNGLTGGLSVVQGSGISVSSGGTSVTVAASAAQLPGTATNDNASAGNLGEYQETIIASGSGVSLTTVTPKTVGSVSLTAGDWDVSAECDLTGNASTTMNWASCSISTTTNTNGTGGTTAYNVEVYNGQTFTNFPSNTGVPAGPVRLSLSGTTTVFFVGTASFGTSTMNMFGHVRARRVR